MNVIALEATLAEKILKQEPSIFTLILQALSSSVFVDFEFLLPKVILSSPINCFIIIQILVVVHIQSLLKIQTSNEFISTIFYNVVLCTLNLNLQCRRELLSRNILQNLHIIGNNSFCLKKGIKDIRNSFGAFRNTNHQTS